MALSSLIHESVKIGNGSVIRPTAIIEENCEIGENCFIGHYAVIRNDWIIGNNTKIGHLCVFEPVGSIGNNVSIQSHCFICDTATIEDWVFIGPGFLSCADEKMTYGRHHVLEYSPKGMVIKYGARIGSGSIIFPKITIGRNAIVGAGAVVTRDVPDGAIVVGIPAKIVGIVPVEERI